MTRAHPSGTTPRRAILAVGLLGALLLAGEAGARVGGGQTFSTGSHSSSGGGGGSVDGDLVWLLIRLVIEWPEVGIPLVIVLAVGALILLRQDARTVRDHQRVVVNHRAAAAGQGALAAAWSSLAARDPALSRPVLDDYLQLVYRRAWAAVGTRDGEALLPFCDASVLSALSSTLPAGSTVHEVVVAAARLDAITTSASESRLQVRFVASRLERVPAGEQRVYVEESWTFRRAAAARSLAPDATTRLGCPSCGAAVRCDPMGRCTHCGAPITAGQLQWQAVQARTELRRVLDRPAVALTPGGRDPSVSFTSVRDPDLAAQLRAFGARHPDFSAPDFERRVRHAFTALQEAWGAGRWEDARPFCTDPAWNTLRFWVERYARVGLRNRVAEVQVQRVEIVKVQQDAWYEAITVRIWASMRDWMEEAATGAVVGGNRDTPHAFSEYWTFLRATGSGAASGAPDRCPSCGAPLDRINAAGECGYCHTVVTTGRFDWVLTRIDQAEVYQG